MLVATMEVDHETSSVVDIVRRVDRNRRSMKVRLKKEIVTLGVAGVSPTHRPAP